MRFNSSEHSVNYSPTSIWTKKLGIFDDQGKTDNKNKCLSLLRQLNRSANIILNDGENEKNVKVSFSSGKESNNVCKDDIFISPDDFLNSKDEFIVDALTGKVLLATQLKRSVDKNTWKKVKLESKGSDFNTYKNIWQAIEQFVAREEVIKNWEGFIPYFVKHSENYISEKDKIQSLLNSNFNIDGFSSMFAWNILFSENSLKIPGQYSEIYDECRKLLDIDNLPADKRWEFSKKVVDIAKKYFKENSSYSGNSHQESTEDLVESKEGLNCPANQEATESNQESTGDNDNESEFDDYKITDNELFGDKVKNKSFSEAKTIDVEAPQEEDYVCRIYENNAEPLEPKFIFKNENKKNLLLREKYLKKFKKEIQSISKCLLFRNTDSSVEDYGHENGAIDENSLHKLAYNDYRIYSEKTIKSKKNIAVCLLVDESGSMMDRDRIDLAKEVAFVLSESMKSVNGLKVCVYGHTAQTKGNDEIEITCYKTFDQQDTSSIFKMDAKQQNIDGHAIKYVAKKFAEDSFSFDKRIMFIISDGEPEGYGYGGDPAIKHTGSVCEFCRKKMSIDIIGIGIDNAFSAATAEKLYGKNKSIVLDDVKKSLSVMSRYIRQISLRM
jgi:hypothetical protein